MWIHVISQNLLVVSHCIHIQTVYHISTWFCVFWLHLRTNSTSTGYPLSILISEGVQSMGGASPNSSKLISISWVLKHSLVNVLFLEFWTSLEQVFLGNDKNPVGGWCDFFFRTSRPSHKDSTSCFNLFGGDVPPKGMMSWHCCVLGGCHQCFDLKNMKLYGLKTCCCQEVSKILTLGAESEIILVR